MCHQGRLHAWAKPVPQDAPRIRCQRGHATSLFGHGRLLVDSELKNAPVAKVVAWERCVRVRADAVVHDLQYGVRWMAHLHRCTPHCDRDPGVRGHIALHPADMAGEGLLRYEVNRPPNIHERVARWQ